MKVAVIGGGIAGLSAAHEGTNSGHDVELFEAGNRVGGLIVTERTPQGLLLEHGPDSILASRPAGVAAVHALGLDDDIVRPSSGAFVLRGEELHDLPAGLLAMSPAAGIKMLRSPLFSRAGKLRFLSEPLVATRRSDEDESVASFFARRFGQEIVDRLVDPLLSGIYGTATRELSMNAVMPRFAEKERQHGSIMGSAFRAMSKRVFRTGPHRRSPLRSPLVGLRNGMSTLTTTLSEELGPRVHLHQAIRAVGARRRGYVLTFADGAKASFDAVVFALPVWHAAKLLGDVDLELAHALSAIEATRLDSVTFAWPRRQIPHALEGTGFVVDGETPRALRACTWVSQKWPGRAPDGTAVLRCFLRLPPWASQEDLVGVARAELREVMGICSQPGFVRVFRRRRALPRYSVGHRERVDSLRTRAAAYPGLVFAGNGYDGIGVPDCIASGAAAMRYAGVSYGHARAN